MKASIFPPINNKRRVTVTNPYEPKFDQSNPSALEDGIKVPKNITGSAIENEDSLLYSQNEDDERRFSSSLNRKRRKTMVNANATDDDELAELESIHTIPSNFEDDD